MVTVRQGAEAAALLGGQRALLGPVPAGLRDEEVQASNLLTTGGAGKAGNPKSFLLASGLVTCLILTKLPFISLVCIFEHICLQG